MGDGSSVSSVSCNKSPGSSERSLIWKCQRAKDRVIKRCADVKNAKRRGDTKFAETAFDRAEINLRKTNHYCSKLKSDWRKAKDIQEEARKQHIKAGYDCSKLESDLRKAKAIQEEARKQYTKADNDCSKLESDWMNAKDILQEATKEHLETKIGMSKVYRKEDTRKNSPFISTLFESMEAKGSGCRWGCAGTTVVITTNQFNAFLTKEEVLGASLQAFYENMMMHGFVQFHTVKGTLQFRHAYFRKGSPELLYKIKGDGDAVYRDPASHLSDDDWLTKRIYRAFQPIDNLLASSTDEAKRIFKDFKGNMMRVVDEVLTA